MAKKSKINCLDGTENSEAVLSFDMPVNTDVYEKFKNAGLTERECDNIELYRGLALCHKVKNNNLNENFIQSLKNYGDRMAELEKAEKAKCVVSNYDKECEKPHKYTIRKNNYRLKYR